MVLLPVLGHALPSCPASSCLFGIHAGLWSVLLGAVDDRTRLMCSGAAAVVAVNAVRFVTQQCCACNSTQTGPEQFKALQVAYAFVVSAFREKDLPAPETKKQS